MTTDARLSTALAEHHKTKKVYRRLKGEGCWALVCLLLWTARNKPSGVFDRMTDEDIELAVNWTGAEGEFVTVLSEAGFLDGEPGCRSLHDWEEHNPWAAGAEARSDKAKHAARMRWASCEHADGMPQAQSSNAPSLILSNTKPTPKPEQAARAAPSRFAEFWDKYPSKDGRKAAEKVWASKHLDALADKIIADVAERAAKHGKWLDGFIPNGSTYLNQERWNDPIAPRTGIPSASRAVPDDLDSIEALKRVAI